MRLKPQPLCSSIQKRENMSDVGVGCRELLGAFCQLPNIAGIRWRIGNVERQIAKSGLEAAIRKLGQHRKGMVVDPKGCPQAIVKAGKFCMSHLCKPAINSLICLEVEIYSRANAQLVTTELGWQCEVAFDAVFLEDTAAHEGAIKEDGSSVHGIELERERRELHAKNGSATQPMK